MGSLPFWGVGKRRVYPKSKCGTLGEVSRLQWHWNRTQFQSGNLHRIVENCDTHSITNHALGGFDERDRVLRHWRHQS